jgi:acyl-CoA synthetase (AMP-forming)/AMP-acid ligase II
MTNPGGLMQFNLADLFEQAADTWPGRDYLVADGHRRTYAEMDARANQLAHHLAACGIGPGDHVGIYGVNSVHWVETLWAVFKLRAVWVNINYRYVETELSYLFGVADLDAVVFDEAFAPRVRSVRDRLNAGAHLIAIGDGRSEEARGLGAVAFEEALAGRPTERDFAARSADDLYVLFTGGTTGMPKGVLWRHEDVLMALGGGVDVVTGQRVTRPQDFVAKAAENPLVAYPIAPLMHGASQWGLMGQAFVGNKVVLSARFDPAEVWATVGRERVNLVLITGNAMARPLLDELARAGSSYDLSSLLAVSSTAALFSQSLKDELAERVPHIVITDAVGSSETGAAGITMVARGTAMKGGPTVNPVTNTVVLDDDLRPVAAGSGVVGRLARTGNIPLGYYNDPGKTAETFRTGGDGVRYAIPGDFATVEADGTITLLGRGSVSINSGGEKIFPEEVEGAVGSHPEVYDVVVVGVPHERWGEQVVAVVQPRAPHRPSLESIQDHCRAHLAGYKVPRLLVVVDEVQRSPAGKPDYRWAAAVAGAAGQPADGGARRG